MPSAHISVISGHKCDDNSDQSVTKASRKSVDYDNETGEQNKQNKNALVLQYDSDQSEDLKQNAGRSENYDQVILGF